MLFEISTASRILFGAGITSTIGDLAAGLGNRALLVSGLCQASTQPITTLLNKTLDEVVVFHVTNEPTVETIETGIRLGRQGQVNLVIGFGGGSALDCAKAIAAMLTNHGQLKDYLEIIGRGLSITASPLPMVAVPTTAGTGSEVTRNAVISLPENGVKVSLRSPLLLPKIALVDPELTYSLSPELTASTGLDALTQLIEPFVCNLPNPITDALCREGMARSICALLPAYLNGGDTVARRDLCLASLMGGIALANARLGAVHGIAGVLGGMLPIPHGAICARLLPIVMDMNLSKLTTGSPDSNFLQRYHEIARIITGSPLALAEDGVKQIFELCASLHIQPLGNLGLTRDHLAELADKASKSSSMKGNPVSLSIRDILEILERAF